MTNNHNDTGMDGLCIEYELNAVIDNRLLWSNFNFVSGLMHS